MCTCVSRSKYNKFYVKKEKKKVTKAEWTLQQGLGSGYMHTTCHAVTCLASQSYNHHPTDNSGPKFELGIQTF